MRGLAPAPPAASVPPPKMGAVTTLTGLLAAALPYGVSAATAGCHAGYSSLQLEMLPEGFGNSACLDGSPVGFWLQKTTNASHANDWQLYFQGGGWCYSAIDCYGRSKTTLGSSKKWPKTQCLGGMLGSDCRLNPDFCQYNRVYQYMPERPATANVGFDLETTEVAPSTSGNGLPHDILLYYDARRAGTSLTAMVTPSRPTLRNRYLYPPPLPLAQRSTGVGRTTWTRC